MQAIHRQNANGAMVGHGLAISRAKSDVVSGTLPVAGVVSQVRRVSRAVSLPTLSTTAATHGCARYSAL